jgi:uncharacterized membrane protein
VTGAPGPPRWPAVASVPLSVLGLAVSAYLTFEHYSSSATLACPDTGVISCAKVTTSSYAELMGVPVALLGMLFYVGVTLLCLPAARRRARSWLPTVRLAVATSGVAFVVYLIWVELFRIDAICLWCTVVHATTIALFGVLVLAAALAPPPSGRNLRRRL